MIRLFFAVFLLLSGLAPLQAQSSWTVPYRNQELQMDGFIEDWSGVPEIVLRPLQAGLQTNGDFADGGLEVSLRALWDEEALYLAIEWMDDVWDVEQVRRRDAVFVTSDRTRRDRMYFHDNIKFQIRELDYDYLLWFSPRVDDQGPFFWQRRLQGMRAMEGATAAPFMTPRQEEGRVTMEIRFDWKELRIKPKKRIKSGLPVLLVVADSDSPDSVPESKLSRLKWLEWAGRMELGKK